MRPKLFCLVLLLSLFTLAQAHVQAAANDPVVHSTYGSYSYTVPNGVVRLTVELWGAGGGGGSGAADTPFFCLDHGGGGGGGGGYLRVAFDVTPGQTYNIVVGRGGGRGSNGSDGDTGGTSSIGTALVPVLFSAYGGAGGEAGVTCDRDGLGGAAGNGGVGAAFRQSGGYGQDAENGHGGFGAAGSFLGHGWGGNGGDDGTQGTDGAHGRAIITSQVSIPIATDDSYTSIQDFPLIISAPGVLGNDIDPSSVGLTASVLTGPAHGTLSLNVNGAFVYTPANGYVGPDNFTYNACDNTSQCDTAIVNINIRFSSELPFSRIAPGVYSFTVPARVTQLQIEAWGGGGAGGGGSEFILSLPPCLAYGGGGGGSGAFGRSVLNVTPGATYQIVVGQGGAPGGISRDGFSGGATEVYNEAGAVLFSVGGGQGGAGAFNCSGHGGGPGSGGFPGFGVTTGVTGGGGLNGFRDALLGGVGGMGGGSFLNRADGGAGGGTAQAGQPGTPGQITIARINTLPDAVDDADVTDEDTPITIDVLANDVDLDGDVLTIQSVTTPGHGTVEIVAGQVEYMPSLNYNGTDSFFYTISDGPNTDLARVDLTINPVNDVPFAENDFATTFSTVPVIIDVLANDGDADGDGLFVTLGTGPANGTASVNSDGTITYASFLGFRGEDSFTYIVDDQEGGTASALVTVTVLNRPPDAVDDSVTTNVDVAVTIPVLGNDSDVDGDPVVLLSVGGAGNGTTVMNGDGTVTYTPNAGFIGTDSFSYDIGDGQGGGDSANVSVTVESIPCTNPNPEADLSGFLLPETGYGTGRVTNSSTTCAYDIGVASYLKFDDVIDNQMLFASNAMAIAPGQTVDISVNLPGCAAQIDLFYGPVLPSLNGVRYGEALLAGYQQPGAYCTAP